MRRSTPIAMAFLLASCAGGSPAAVAPSPAPASPAPATAAVATPATAYSPKAEGFASKQLVEKKRTLGLSAPGQIWIVAGLSSDGTGVSATVSEKETFTASYQVPVDPRAADAMGAAYLTPELPPLPAGLYGESLTLITVQAGGRSGAHMHSGIEGVLVLEGTVLVRTAGQAPVHLVKGQGFFILPKTPVQLINVGGVVARTLVFSISPDGAPFSTPLDTAP